jgi:hypothetical protein
MISTVMVVGVTPTSVACNLVLEQDADDVPAPAAAAGLAVAAAAAELD